MERSASQLRLGKRIQPLVIVRSQRRTQHAREQCRRAIMIVFISVLSAAAGMAALTIAVLIHATPPV